MVIAGANPFVFFGPAHTVALVLTIAMPAGLAVIVRGSGSEKLTRWICILLASTILFNELAYYVYGVWAWGIDVFIKTGLPLHLCGVGVYLSAYALLARGQFAYELAYFWGVGGTLQAIITPNLTLGFPSYSFVQFFITHCGIVTAVLFATWGLKMRPRFKSGFYAFLLINAFALLLAPVNWMLGSNYMFLCGPPAGIAGQSPFFAIPWPWYLLLLEFVALALFGLLYALFPLADWVRRRRN